MDNLKELLVADIKNEKPIFEKEFNDYVELNSLITNIDELDKKYEDVLLEYGTAELKQTVGLLSTILRNIELNGFKGAIPIFEMLQQQNLYPLAIFYAKRVIEKYQNPETKEEFIVLLEGYKKILELLYRNNDRFLYLKYLTELLEELEEFIRTYPEEAKYIYQTGSDLYQLFYITYLTIFDDKSKALGYLIRNYQFNQFILKNGLGEWERFNNILITINIVGLYSYIEDSLEKEFVDIETYIKDFLEDVKVLKEKIHTSGWYKNFYLRGEGKRYLSEFLLNIYVLGYEDFYKEIVDQIPNLINKEHKLIVEMDKLQSEDLQETEFLYKMKKLKKQINMLLNNTTDFYKENLLYMYFKNLIDYYEENLEKLEEIKNEMAQYTTVLKDSVLLNLLKAKIYYLEGDIEKAKSIANQQKLKALSQGRQSVVKVIERFLEDLE